MQKYKLVFFTPRPSTQTVLQHSSPAFRTTSAASARTPAAEAVTFPDLYEASIAELQAGLDGGQFTSVDLVKVWHHLHLCTI